MEIGSVLRESRLNSKMSVEQVSKILTDQGFKASQKTVYSWENGNSRPDIEILMKLCDIYGIKDILRTFGYDGYKKDGSLQLNMKEIDIVEKYRFISTHSADGAIIVDTVLDREYSIAQQLQGKDEQINELEKELLPRCILAYYGKIAAAGQSYGFDDVIVGTIECPLTDQSQKADYAIGISGDSMEPTFSDGDIVYVSKNAHLDVGDIGIFQKDNGIYIKEVGENELISHNPRYKPITNEGDILCLGKVIGKIEE